VSASFGSDVIRESSDINYWGRVTERVAPRGETRPAMPHVRYAIGSRTLTLHDGQSSEWRTGSAAVTRSFNSFSSSRLGGLRRLGMVDRLGLDRRWRG